MIFKPENPRKWFHTIRDGLHASIRMSGGYVAIGDIYMNIGRGEWELYIVADPNTNYKGFAVVEYIPLANGLWMNIPFAYAEGDCVNEFLNYASEHAKEYGLAGVKFISSRPGFERVAKLQGWKRGFQEFIVADYTQGDV